MIYNLKSINKTHCVILEDGICIDADEGVKNLIGKTLDEIRTFVTLKGWTITEGE